MTFPSRRAQSLAILQRTGIWRSNYEPPYLRVLWRMGIEIPPPHFAPFFQTAVFAAAWFGFAWGTFMWFSIWSRQGLTGTMAVAISAVAGLCFGFSMALYYAYGRRKHRLPSWTSLDEVRAQQ